VAPSPTSARPRSPRSRRRANRPLPQGSAGRGPPVSEEGTDAYLVERNQLLGLLVYREELRQAAKRLGVTVSEDEISKRLAAAGQPDAEQNGDSSRVRYESGFAPGS